MSNPFAPANTTSILRDTFEMRLRGVVRNPLGLETAMPTATSTSALQRCKLQWDPKYPL